MTLDAAFAELPNDADVLGGHGDLLLFEPGTVGWDGVSPHYDTEDGVTLVRVTLIRGRHPSTPLQPDVAQGYQVLARIGGGLFRIPAPGTPVMVGFPTAFADHPGAGVIVCTTETSPDVQFSATKAKFDVGADTDFVIKAKSITISDYGNRFLHVGPDGVMLQDDNGNGVVMSGGAIMIYVADGGYAKTLVQMTTSELSLVQKDTGMVKLTGGNATVLASGSAAIVGGNVSLGAQATAATPAMIGPPPGVPSKSVFLSA
ncbi:MAG: hypothetical protein ACRELB_24585 [Polyangiaceae bacterium]